MPKREGRVRKTGSGDGGERKPVTIYLPPELHKDLRIRSIEEGRTASDIATEAIRDYLKGHKRG